MAEQEKFLETGVHKSSTEGVGVDVSGNLE